MDALTLTAAALFTFRLTRLITDDKITQVGRTWVKKQAPRKIKDEVAYGIGCPFCVSGYVAIVCTGLLFCLGALHPWYSAPLWWGAIWGGSILLNELFVYLSKNS